MKLLQVRLQDSELTKSQEGCLWCYNVVNCICNLFHADVARFVSSKLDETDDEDEYPDATQDMIKQKMQYEYLL